MKRCLKLWDDRYQITVNVDELSLLIFNGAITGLEPVSHIFDLKF